MRVRDVSAKGSWHSVAEDHGVSIDKSDEFQWRRRVLLREYRCVNSINIMRFEWTWSNTEADVVSAVRDLGVELTGVSRDGDYRCRATPWSTMNASRRLLCTLADQRQASAWRGLLDALRGVDESTVAACVPECVYRGFCPERDPCWYNQTEGQVRAKLDYRHWARAHSCMDRRNVRVASANHKHNTMVCERCGRTWIEESHAHDGVGGEDL